MPRVTAARKARLEETRRTQILEAAARIFARKGFDRATVSDVAQAAGLSEGSIYNYFRSKEDLLIHIPEHLVQPVLAPVFDEEPRSVAEIEQRLLVLSRAMVARVQEYAPFLQVFLSALPHLSGPARERYMQLLPTYAGERLESLLRAGIRRQIFRADLDPAIVARVLPGMLLMFLMTREVLGQRLVPHEYDEIAREAVRVFLYGTILRASAAQDVGRGPKEGMQK